MQSVLKYILSALFLLGTLFTMVPAQVSMEREILDGSETIVKYGLDTTDNWWAISEPFTERYRLIVNGDETHVVEAVDEPVFSPDGIYWAAFAISDNQWSLLTNVGDVFLEFDRVGRLSFSRDSKTLAFVGYLADDAWLVRYRIRGTDYEDQALEQQALFPAINPTDNVFISNKGDYVAYIGARGSSLSISVNDKEGGLFDEIHPIGFFPDDSFLYAARLGVSWRVYRNNESVSASYQLISDVALNRQGNVAGFIGQQVGGAVVVMLSDELPEPVFSREYDNAYGLTLHPSRPVSAFKGELNNVRSVIYSGARYGGGGEYGPVRFSHDGAELHFLDCDLVNCYINVNGKRHTLATDFAADQEYVMAPETSTLAFVTAMTLVVRKFDSNEFVAGKIVDEIKSPRFNRRSNRYEALGRVNERIYLLVCQL